MKTTSKGQLTIPVDIMRAMGIEKGTELLLVQENDRLVLAKASDVGQGVVDDLAGWERLAEPSLAEIWDDPENDVWDEA